MVQKANFAVMDFIVLNAYFAWNISAPDVSGRFEVERYEFNAALSEEMLTNVDTHGEEVGVQVNLQYDELNRHHPITVNHHKTIVCTVCKLEEGWMKPCNIRQAFGEGSRHQQHMSMYITCRILAHSLHVSLNWSSFKRIHLWESLVFTLLLAPLVQDCLFLKLEWTIWHWGEVKQWKSNTIE